MAYKPSEAVKNLRASAQDEDMRGTVMKAMGTVAVLAAVIVAAFYGLIILLGVTPWVAWTVYGLWLVWYGWNVNRHFRYVFERAEVVDEVPQGDVEEVAKKWRF